MMLLRYFSLVLAGLLLGAAPARADAVFSPTSDQFSITETVINGVGQYTVANNSTDAYIWQFVITHSPEAHSPTSTQYQWTGAEACLGNCASTPNAFRYSNIAGGTFGTIAFDLAPGTVSDGFFFQSGSPASKWEIFVFDANGKNFTTICSDAADPGCGGVAAAVPGPAVGAGLPGLLMAIAGFISWRRSRRAL
jgi:hypothetical protein